MGANGLAVDGPAAGLLRRLPAIRMGRRCYETAASQGARETDMTDQPQDTRQLHDTLDFIGLRAHATAAGLVQLCSELVAAGVIDIPAVERIKAVIHRELMLTQGRRHDRGEFGVMLRERLDAIFPQDDHGQRAAAVGGVDAMKSALEPAAAANETTAPGGV